MHTPGKWEYEDATKTIRAKPSNYWLASMNSFEGAVNHKDNARLIASAPELLEALQAVADEAQMGGLSRSGGIISSDTWELVTRAIDRATKEK